MLPTPALHMCCDFRLRPGNEFFAYASQDIVRLVNMHHFGGQFLRNFYLCLLFLNLGTTCSQASSSKRGLCFTPNTTTPQDDDIWIHPPKALSWYYSYGMTPPPTFEDKRQDQFEFVPMLWGAPASAANSTFLEIVESLIGNGHNVSHVMYVSLSEGIAKHHYPLRVLRPLCPKTKQQN